MSSPAKTKPSPKTDKKAPSTKQQRTIDSAETNTPPSSLLQTTTTTINNNNNKNRRRTTLSSSNDAAQEEHEEDDEEQDVDLVVEDEEDEHAEEEEEEEDHKRGEEEILSSTILKLPDLSCPKKEAMAERAIDIFENAERIVEVTPVHRGSRYAATKPKNAERFAILGFKRGAKTAEIIAGMADLLVDDAATNAMIRAELNSASPPYPANFIYKFLIKIYRSCLKDAPAWNRKLAMKAYVSGQTPVTIWSVASGDLIQSMAHAIDPRLLQDGTSGDDAREKQTASGELFNSMSTICIGSAVLGIWIGVKDAELLADLSVAGANPNRILAIVKAYKKRFGSECTQHYGFFLEAVYCINGVFVLGEVGDANGAFEEHLVKYLNAAFLRTAGAMRILESENKPLAILVYLVLGVSWTGMQVLQGPKMPKADEGVIKQIEVGFTQMEKYIGGNVTAAHDIAAARMKTNVEAINAHSNWRCVDTCRLKLRELDYGDARKNMQLLVPLRTEFVLQPVFTAQLVGIPARGAQDRNPQGGAPSRGGHGGQAHGGQAPVSGQTHVGGQAHRGGGGTNVQWRGGGRAHGGGARGRGFGAAGTKTSGFRGKPV